MFRVIRLNRRLTAVTVPLSCKKLDVTVTGGDLLHGASNCTLDDIIECVCIIIKHHSQFILTLAHDTYKYIYNHQSHNDTHKLLLISDNIEVPNYYIHNNAHITTLLENIWILHHRMFSSLFKTLTDTQQIYQIIKIYNITLSNQMHEHAHNSNIYNFLNSIRKSLIFVAYEHLQKLVCNGIHPFSKMIRYKIDPAIFPRCFKNVSDIYQILKPNIDTIIQNEMFNTSCDIFKSSLTLTNWYDELSSGSIIGLLVNVQTTKNTINATLADHATVLNYTTTYLPLDEYCELVHKTMGVFDSSLINDSSIGLCNSIFPLYINRHHWAMTKQYIENIISLTLTHHPLCYHKTYIHYIFYMLTEMTHHTYCIKVSNNWLFAYFAVWRTAVEVAIESGYIRGIHNLLMSVLSDKPKHKIANMSFSYFTILGQILCSGVILSSDDFTKLTKYITTEITNNTPQVASKCLEILIACHNMQQVLSLLYDHAGSFNKFVKELDTHYGCLPPVYIDLVQKLIY